MIHYIIARPYKGEVYYYSTPLHATKVKWVSVPWHANFYRTQDEASKIASKYPDASVAEYQT